MPDDLGAGVFVEQDMSEARILPAGGGRVAVYSAASPERPGPNQDAAAVIPAGPERAVLAVADGMGGVRGGASAAQIAIRSLRDAVRDAADSEGSLRAAILDAVEQANRKVMDLGLGAATTLVVAELDGATLRPYHVGDSAVLVVGQRGKLKLQTIAHSPVGYAVEAGLLDEEDAINHDDRHVISNMVGSADMRIEVGSKLALAARDTVLLASDGAFDNMGLQEIIDAIRIGAQQRVAETLARVCGERMRAPREGAPSKPDDLTFLLFRWGRWLSC